MTENLHDVEREQSIKRTKAAMRQAQEIVNDKTASHADKLKALQLLNTLDSKLVTYAVQIENERYYASGEKPL